MRFAAGTNGSRACGRRPTTGRETPPLSLAWHRRVPPQTVPKDRHWCCSPGDPGTDQSRVGVRGLTWGHESPSWRSETDRGSLTPHIYPLPGTGRCHPRAVQRIVRAGQLEAPSSLVPQLCGDRTHNRAARTRVQQCTGLLPCSVGPGLLLPVRGVPVGIPRLFCHCSGGDTD